MKIGFERAKAMPLEKRHPGKNMNLFNRYKCYANAVAWVYQKDLFDIEKFV